MGELNMLQLSVEDEIGFIRMNRPEAGNAINDPLVAAMAGALRDMEGRAKVVVLEGSPEVFCTGADFKEIQGRVEAGQLDGGDPGPLYDLWRQLACGPFVTIAHVRGRANAGGIGFVAACDIVLCDEKATFSLSELLFGLMPACVMPFLVRRIGFARANTFTLTTQPATAKQALEWGLVDACEAGSENLLRKHLLRLRRLGKTAVARYKRYADGLDGSLRAAREPALAANLDVFSDPDNLHRIARYVQTGKFPWETD